MNYRIRRLAVLAMLTALEIVLSRFLSFSSATLKISLAFAPVAVAAMLYGPLWAGCVGALADLIGALLFPIGAFFPGFTVTALLVGVVYGLFLYNRKVTFFQTLPAAVIISAGLHIMLNSFWLAVMMATGFMKNPDPARTLYAAWIALMSTRVLSNAVMIVVQIILILLLGHWINTGMIPAKNAQLDMLRTRARTYFVNAPALRQSISEAITRRAVSLPQYAGAHTVFCFVGTEREIDTAPLLEQALADGKQLCVPLSLRDGIMTARKITSLAELSSVGLYGIREPDGSAPIIDPQEIDLAFVPCSAADRARNRLGKGGGYYDRYLKNTNIVKIGLCPRALMVSRLPYHKTDLPMDKIITERGVVPRN